MNSRGVVEGEMGAILKGPHIKTYIKESGERFVMIEPLQFVPLRNIVTLNNAMIRRAGK